MIYSILVIHTACLCGDIHVTTIDLEEMRINLMAFGFSSYFIPANSIVYLA